MEIQPVVLLVMFEMTGTNVSSVNDRNICYHFDYNGLMSSRYTTQIFGQIALYQMPWMKLK